MAQDPFFDDLALDEPALQDPFFDDLALDGPALDGPAFDEFARNPLFPPTQLGLDQPALSELMW